MVWLPLLVAAGAAASVFLAPIRATATEQRAGAPSDVAQIYLADCGVCHGNDARGTDRGPSLVGVGRASLDFQLSSGRMPLTAVGRANDQPGTPLRPLPDKALGDPHMTPRRHNPAYPPQTIARLVDYTAALAGGDGPDIPRVGEGDVAKGGEVFRLQCAACHAWAGDGGALVHREAPSLHGATATQIAEVVRVGSGQMPAFGTAALGPHELDSIVAYVRYLDDPRDRGGNPLWHLGPFAEGGVALAAVAGLLLFVRWIGERG